MNTQLADRVRKPTSGDLHRDNIASLMQANPGVEVTGAVMAMTLGITEKYWHVLRNQLLAQGRLLLVSRKTGRNGGCIYAVPAEGAVQ